MKRMHVLFSGAVQGIGFRFTCRDIAENLGNISGTVENLFDRRVELVAEGEEENLVEFLQKITEYFGRNIRDKKIEWENATHEFKGFTIK